MVLAAGLGTRLQPYTLQTPKPLVPLLGVPCIEYSLQQLPRAGVETVVVNVHSHSLQMIDYLRKSALLNGVEIRVSDESQKLLGSAGGFRKALPLIESVPGESESFFALNADVVSAVDLQQLAVRHRELQKKHGVQMTLCLADGKMLESQQGAYTEIMINEENGLVVGIGEKKKKVPFYTGTAVFETECFRHLTDGVPSEFVPEVLMPMIRQGKVGFFKVDQLWLDVGSPELWWKSHFELHQEFTHGKTPSFWSQMIQDGSKKVYLSEAEGVVDYDHFSTGPITGTGKYIRFRGVRTDV
jgi:mannose-1-phosphate guanylyltransferase